MKKYLRLLFLFLLPLTLAACSEDDNDSKDKWWKNSEKAYFEDITVTGQVYQEGNTWRLSVHPKHRVEFHFGYEDAWEIKIGKYPENISLPDIQNQEKTFRGDMILQNVESDGIMMVAYQYIFDIVEIK